MKAVCLALVAMLLLVCGADAQQLPRRPWRSAPSKWSVTSVVANLFNNSTQPLYLKSCQMNEGKFDTFPNQTVAMGTTNTFSSESDGDGDTQGACSWGVGLTLEVLSVYWRDPIIGENSFQIVINPGTYFTVSYTGGSGYHTTINIIVSTWSGGGAKPMMLA